MEHGEWSMDDGARSWGEAMGNSDILTERTILNDYSALGFIMTPIFFLLSIITVRGC
jgi:hypothetical protein